MVVLNAKKEDDRVAAYRDLTHYAGKVVGYARDAIAALEVYRANGLGDMLAALNLVAQLKRAVGLLKVISQTERRVFRNEKVPVSEKVVSFFDHTTSLSRRGVNQFGHKIF
jgi:IS5 family transposase